MGFPQMVHPARESATRGLSATRKPPRGQDTKVYLYGVEETYG